MSFPSVLLQFPVAAVLLYACEETCRPRDVRLFDTRLSVLDPVRPDSVTFATGPDETPHLHLSGTLKANSTVIVLLSHGELLD